MMDNDTERLILDIRALEGQSERLTRSNDAAAKRVIGELTRLSNDRDSLRAYAVQLRDMLRQFIKTTPSGGFETRLDRDADALMAKFAYAIGERPDADDKAMAALVDGFGHETNRDPLYVGDELDAMAEEIDAAEELRHQSCTKSEGE